MKPVGGKGVALLGQCYSCVVTFVYFPVCAGTYLVYVGTVSHTCYENMKPLWVGISCMTHQIQCSLLLRHRRHYKIYVN